ncbi:Ktr system potassium transporter KtrB [Halomonas shantousis]
MIRFSPPELLLLGFALLSAVGTLLLHLPIAAYTPLAWNEALFTATSAVTVTGLTIVDTSGLTLFGQIVVLSLIQLGGLGFMTFTALTLLLLGMRLPLQQQKLLRESLSHTSFKDLVHLVRLIILFALIAETCGALLLAISWVPEYGPLKGAWFSVFHAISAFNNAGFSTWPDSLASDVANPLVNGVISVLFITGGLGFVVIAELIGRRRQAGLSLHARLVLLTTLALIGVSMIALLLLEWRNPATLGGLDGIGARLQAAWFQAVTPRSAGFNTVDTGALTAPSTLLTMLLMFIGAGPGSTASGIKVTTFVILFLVARAFLRGSAQPAALGRAIPEETVLKAVAVALAGMLLIFTSLFALTLTEPDKAFLDLAFETVSAFGTVGLSRGITGEMSLPGQLVLIVTMLLGRAGPITLGYFIATRRQRGIRYAEGQVHIG